MREYRRKEGERNPGCQSACLLCLHFTRLLKCYFEPQTAVLNPAGTTLEPALPHPPTHLTPPGAGRRRPAPGSLYTHNVMDKAFSHVCTHRWRQRRESLPPRPQLLFLPPSPTPGVPLPENSAAVGQKAGTRDNWSPRTLKPVSGCFLRLSILPRGSKGGVQRTTLLVLFDSLFPSKDR